MRYKKRKKTYEKLKELLANSATTLVIHYSCERFFDIPGGKSPRITSIAILHLESKQILSFSIHKVAEEIGIDTENISAKYNDLEKRMLNEFADYVSHHLDYNWLHWNMRDIGFGFLALEHRHKVLGGLPPHIPDEHKYDLTQMLKDIYGSHYAPHPRMMGIAKLNDKLPRGMVCGEKEAKLFEEKRYVDLHLSTISKVRFFSEIAELAIERKLKTASSFADRYGISPNDIGEYIKEHWLFTLVTLIAAILGIVAIFLKI